MKVGIIGAGFTGLSAGYYLAKSGISVTIFESDGKPGGLAIGFTQKNWKWSLEAHYHHCFTNDDSILGLAKEIGFPVVIKRPKTSVFRRGSLFQLDSPISLLKVPNLSLIDKLRTGVILFYLKYITPWQALEKYTAEKFLKATMGSNSWKVLWEPLFVGKFGKYADKIPASWFWARIKKRTPSLAYPEGGFLAFALSLDKKIKDLGGVIKYDSPINKIATDKGKIIIEVNGKKEKFDRVICTLPTPLFLKLTADLPKSYIKELKPLVGIGAVNLVLTLNNQFFSDGSYWLNVNEQNFPFLAVVEHTNYMDKKYYGGEHILYVGNYLPHDHKYFGYSEAELLNEFMPYLKNINKQFDNKKVVKSYVFKAPFAQPIIPLNYSKSIPKMITPIKGLYLANIQMVYPWDRGTNYAVEMGQKVAKIITNNNE
jgi:protoporphyrinogen oxidase